MKRLLICASALCLATPAMAESLEYRPPETPQLIKTYEVLRDGAGLEALAGVELPTVGKGETSWSAGIGLDGAIGVGLQHGLGDGFSIYIKGAKKQGEDPVGFVGVAGRF